MFIILTASPIMVFANKETTISDAEIKTVESMEARLRQLMLSGQNAQAVTLAAGLRALFPAETSPQGDEAAARAFALSGYLQLVTLAKSTAESEAWFERAQAELDRLGPDTAPGTQAELNSFRVYIFARTGRPGEGQSLALSAYGEQVKVSGETSDRSLTALQILSASYLLNGQYREARPYAQKLVTLLEQIRPGSFSVGIACNNLGAVYSALGQPQRARPLLEKTIGLLETHLGPAHPNVAMVRSNLALQLKDEGLFNEAVPIYAKAGETLLRSLPPGHPHRITLLGNYAFVLAETGRTAEALTIFAQAQAEIEQASGPKILALASNFYLQARAHLLAGLPREALALGDRAAAALPAENPPLDVVYDLHKYRLQALLALDNRPAARAEAVRLQETRYAWLQQQLSFTSENERLSSLRAIPPFDAVASTGEPGLIATAALRLKGLVIEAMLEDETLARHSKDPAISSLLSRLRQTKPGISDSERQLLEEKLARSVADLGVSRRALTVEVGSVAQSLAAHEALIEYISYRQWLPDGKSRPSFGALLLLPGSAPRWLPLGDAGPIDQAIFRYEQYVRDGGSDRWLADLRTLILDPVLSALPAAATKLYFSPDAALHAVSFASLPLADGKFLSEKFVVAFVNSGRDLLPGLQPGLRAGETVGLANPAFAPSLHFEPLPNSTAEVDALLGAAGKKQNSRLLTGAAATAASLQALTSPYVLHLATHGFSPEPDDEHANPALTSYLALAGTDRLTAADAANLDLKNTWLTTLAACDSGRGSIAIGEGLLGLRRGFLRAGTRHLALALWKLPDDAITQQLLADFYADVFAGQLPENALSHAQQKQLRALATAHGTGTAIRKAGSLIVVLRK